MIIDNKQSLMRSFIQDPKLGAESARTKLSHTLVTSPEQKSINLQLNADEKGSNQNNQKKKPAAEALIKPAQENKAASTTSSTLKKLNLKLLNLL